MGGHVGVGPGATALYFVPRYLRMGLTTIPEYLGHRFDGFTRTLVALFLIFSYVVTLLPIVLFTGAINLESIFNISALLGVTKAGRAVGHRLMVGAVGSVYAIFGRPQGGGLFGYHQWLRPAHRGTAYSRAGLT